MIPDHYPIVSPDTIDQLVRDTMPLGYVVWDSHGNGIDCSPRLVQMFGFQSPQEVFDHWHFLSPPEQPLGYPAESYLTQFLAQVAPRNTTVSMWQHKTRDGKLFSVEVTCLQRTMGGSEWIIGYFRDLRDSAGGGLRFADIFRSCPICFAVLSEDSFTFVTPSMENLLGVKAGDSFSSLFIDPEASEKLCKDPPAEEINDSWTAVTVRTASGDIKEMLACAPRFDESNDLEKMIWMFDITESQRIERGLRMSIELAEANSKAKSEFLANMSHDIRTPMNAIIGLTHLALQTPLTEQQREYIETVQLSGHTLLRLINGILDLSKIEARRMFLEYREFSIADTVSEIVAVVGVRIQDKNLKLQVDMDKNLPATVMGDSIRLHQVISNLLANAVKFTEKGTIRLNAEVDESDMLSVVVRFSVTDSGIGMTPSQIRGLFKPFSQASIATTRQYGGTGLGLAISKHIVDLMHGEIVCQSEKGVGSTFSFTARFGVPLKDEVASIDEFTEVRTGVLLVGDCKEDQELMQHYFELLTAKVYRCGGELSGFKEILDSGRIRDADFIVFGFSDLREGFIPSYKALQEKCSDSMPVCVLTEHPERESVLEELGIKDSVVVIKKPIIAGDLFNVLANVAAHKEELRRQKRAALRQMADQSSEAVVTPQSIRGAKILLVDDNKVNQLVAKELLRVEGYETTVADNGRIAIELLNKQKFDLVLMDVQMPEMDGFEATRLIRSDERFHDIPILAMTANAMTGDRDLCLEAGMNEHIAKPIDPNTLYKALVKWIRK